MNKHERRAFDAGVKAREMQEPRTSNPMDAPGSLGGILANRWDEGWVEADNLIRRDEEKNAEAVISDDAREWLELARECDGCEMPRSAWPLGEELVKAGLATLGHGRGPGGDFRRLYVEGDDDER